MHHREARKPRGRPKADPAEKMKNRHVVNLNDPVQEAVDRVCAEVGLNRTTEGIRLLVVEALKARGRLK